MKELTEKDGTDIVAALVRQHEKLDALTASIDGLTEALNTLPSFSKSVDKMTAAIRELPDRMAEILLQVQVDAEPVVGGNVQNGHDKQPQQDDRDRPLSHRLKDWLKTPDGKAQAGTGKLTARDLCKLLGSRMNPGMRRSIGQVMRGAGYVSVIINGKESVYRPSGAA